MIDINTRLVQTLIKVQFPQFSYLSIRPVAKSGNDNRTFHLGDDMTVRLPSDKCYVPQVEKELRWLPILAQYLSLPISSPIAKGEPTKEYAFPWLINKWIEGDSVTKENVMDLCAFAVDLATFLKELEAINTDNGPLAGKHNFFRGGDLNVYHEETQAALKNIGGVFPEVKLNNIWTTAIRSKWEKANVWVHGDVAEGNLLVQKGKLCGVIDFGILGVGDPACDYVMAWTFFDKQSRVVFYNELDCGEDTWCRAKGWALWKALIVYDDSEDKMSEMAIWAKHTINELLQD